MTVGTQIKIIMSGVELNTYSTVGDSNPLADLGLANGPTNIEKGYKNLLVGLLMKHLLNQLMQTLQ